MTLSKQSHKVELQHPNCVAKGKACAMFSSLCLNLFVDMHTVLQAKKINKF